MAERKTCQESISLQFKEKMSGFISATDDFVAGEKRGRAEGNYLSFEVTITIKDLEDFYKLSGRKASLTGFVSSKIWGEKIPIYQGEFALFIIDKTTGQKRMIYSFSFRGNDGEDYTLYGYKIIQHDPAKIDLVADLTSLYTCVYKRPAKVENLWGAGILRFKISTLPEMLASFTVIPAPPIWRKTRILSKFFSFCYGEVQEAYLNKLSAVFYTEYENLVLTGRIRNKDGAENDFLFFSGIHGQGFPWGDEESFWDIALVIPKDKEGWCKLALSDRVIEGLYLDIDKGVYQYSGDLFLIKEGEQLYKSELKRKNLSRHIERVKSKIKINFNYEKYAPINIPFGLIKPEEKFLKKSIEEILFEWIPLLNSLGFTLTPWRVFSCAGKIEIIGKDFKEEYFLIPEKTFGEAEKGTLSNLRWPKLAYKYNCQLSAQRPDIFITLQTDILWQKRRDFRDKSEEFLGQLIKQIVSLKLHLQPGKYSKILSKKTTPFYKEERLLLEIINDHFPSAVLKRKMLIREDAQGQIYGGLEEETDPLNLGSINSERIVKVAAIKDENKFRALDEVLSQTGFFDKLAQAQQVAHKSKAEFSIIIKPNFMFMYSLNDPSTYTDPELIEYLIDRIYEKGYRNIACAEARSTYGIFFTNREVKTVAQYIGLKAKNYRIIDLSEDLVEFSFSGKLGQHYVNRAWQQADFRISFAKNKTHSYAFYTLAIKNIYGALPLENKFFEYHHQRDIFETTIAFIQAFPVHFALIDAHLSADGPFGIFADKNPNPTQTIIGSEDLVATDWIGAAKMGLDPLVSDYMRRAVKAFGKPHIQLIGDRSIYPHWVNVSDIIPLIAFNVLDRQYYFGNLFYSVFAYMDEFFQYKDPGLGRKLARVLAHPLKTLFFQKIKKGEFEVNLNKKLFAKFSKFSNSR
ncbi:MAG: DUF362 domain-containing protein [Thermodesulfobacteriota bacterium]